MLVSSTQNIISVLGLAAAISALPLNERTSSKRGIVGWLCHYDGPSSPAVDVSLDLPSMLGGLCAKVNYDYDGCESFKPNTKPINPDLSPQDDGSAVHSESVDDDEPQENEGQRVPTPKKKKKQIHPQDTSVQATPVPQDENVNDSTHKRPKHKKNPTHPKKSEDDSDHPVNAQSFNSAGDAEPNHSSHHSKGLKSHKPASEEDPNTAVNSLSDGESDTDDTHGCDANSYYSSEAGRCIDHSYFSKPQRDGSCESGNLEAVINLCLDVSLLGLSDPLRIEASALKYGSGRSGAPKCPLGQQYSSLLSVCINDKFFSDPLVGHQCGNGWKLDLVLGICLDLIGCQNQPDES